jgi:hypothetical protein
MSTDPKYDVSIVWGRLDMKERPTVYHFETLVERNAFMRGVDAAVGWSEYSLVPTKERKYG